MLCPENKLNYNGSYFFKDQGEKRSRTGGSASIFNEEIWKKNHILLSSFSGQSTIILILAQFGLNDYLQVL